MSVKNEVVAIATVVGDANQIQKDWLPKIKKAAGTDLTLMSSEGRLKILCSGNRQIRKTACNVIRQHAHNLDGRVVELAH